MTECETCHQITLRTMIAQSNDLTLRRCGCGYWLEIGGHLRKANEVENSLAQIVEALARLKLPGAVSEARRV